MDFINAKVPGDNGQELSGREREVLILGAEGNTDREIAEALGLSVNTVATHWERLRVKLNASNRGEAIAKALAGACRAALSELAEANRWSQLIVDNTEDLAIFTMDEEGMLLSWNSGVQRVLGYDESGFVKQNVAMLFEPADQQAGAPEFERDTALRHGRAIDCRWHLRRDGTQIWVEGSLIALNGEGPVRLAKVMHDGTALRQLREEVERLRDQVRELTPPPS